MNFQTIQEFQVIFLANWQSKQLLEKRILSRSFMPKYNRSRGQVRLAAFNDVSIKASTREFKHLKKIQQRSMKIEKTKKIFTFLRKF